MGFAGIDHALAFGGRVQGNGADQESVLEVGQVVVQVVLPLRRMPMTASALPWMRGRWTSRRVCAGTAAASASAIFCRMSC